MVHRESTFVMAIFHLQFQKRYLHLGILKTCHNIYRMTKSLKLAVQTLPYMALAATSHDSFLTALFKSFWEILEEVQRERHSPQPEPNFS